MITRACGTVLAVWTLLAARPTWAAIHVDVTPGSTQVVTGQEFDVTLSLAASGSPFNAFEFVLGYDPTSLQLLPATPSKSQEGCLVTGGCSTACGSTFHQFQAAGDSVVVTDVLLCSKVVVTGPGALYRLRFRALAGRTPQTTITLRRVRFSNAGLIVPEVTGGQATILDPALLGVGDGPSRDATLRVEPNPSRGRVQLVIPGDVRGLTRVQIVDAQGRTVRRLATAWTLPGARLEWDGTDDDGRTVPTGVYLARLDHSGRVHTTRVVRVR